MKHFLLLLLLPSFLSAQTAKQDTFWDPLNFFIGEWNGAGEGQPGKGVYERTYKFILGNKFIEIKNKATYLPTEKKPTGEVHKDIGYISYDRGKKKFLLRQFHIEGFVNTYALDEISPDKKALVFLTERIENIPAGWKAKESYQLVSDDEFVETFELAEPGKDFVQYTKVRFTRK
ncbi:MAG: hypothetical protein HY562_08165 [Ignavibacteriales bacterium]|nr:hypothetical protein [Ignavibacteriales bacterium]